MVIGFSAPNSLRLSGRFLISVRMSDGWRVLINRALSPREIVFAGSVESQVHLPDSLGPLPPVDQNDRPGSEVENAPPQRLEFSLIERSEICREEHSVRMLQVVRDPGGALPGRDIIQQVAGSLALLVSIGQDAVVAAGLDEKPLVPGVVIIVRLSAFDDKIAAQVTEKKSALVEMLMVVERAGSEDKHEVVVAETGAEDGRARIPE
jgi:hypothetical protein